SSYLVCPTSFSHRPPPPPSTLFPYTTLFRSIVAVESGIDDRAVPTFIMLPEYSLRKDEVAEAVALASAAPANTAVVFGVAQLPRDRKSTRLNSSHVAISYAVFCLKKKK